jgi:hypothetical protein
MLKCGIEEHSNIRISGWRADDTLPDSTPAVLYILV